jgi:hypothetical protein
MNLENLIRNSVLNAGWSNNGFSLVGLLYLLGKFDERKKDYTHQWMEFVDNQSKFSDESNRFTDEFLKIVRESKIGKTPLIGDVLHRVLKNKKERIDWISSLDSLTKEAVNLFGLIDRVSRDMRSIVVYMSAGIILSFYGLFSISNGLTSSWSIFLNVISLITTATYYYYLEWKSMRELYDIIDRHFS